MSAAAQATKELAGETDKPVLNRAEAFGWLPCSLSLEVPVTGFTVGDLLRLNKGSVVETSCHHTQDIPLFSNGLLIGWTEFEVIANHLAVRITELA